MTCEEFSNAFDLLVSSYKRFKDFDNKENLDSIEFDEYEKSMFLTKAQEELVVALYNGRNSSGESFESTEELRRYLSNLVKEDTEEPITNTLGIQLGINSQSKFFTLPEDLWFITYESLKLPEEQCDAFKEIDIYPVTQDDYNKTKRNPFRGPNDRRALRLDLSDGVVEIISKYNTYTLNVKYYIRYLRKPKPIVLAGLPNGLQIEGISEPTEYGNSKQACELHEALHQKILESAVMDALRSKGITENKQ